MYIKQFIFSIFVCFLAFACGDNNNSNSNEKSSEQKENTSQKEESESKSDDEELDGVIMGDLNNQGVGPYKDVNYEGTPNPDLVAKGKTIFDGKCVACHTIDKVLVGPPMKGIFERRNASWILNMIATPQKMLEQDKDAKELQEMYGGQVMLDMQLKDEEVKALGEYIRSL